MSENYFKKYIKIVFLMPFPANKEVHKSRRGCLVSQLCSHFHPHESGESGNPKTSIAVDSRLQRNDNIEIFSSY